jgi:hypothetical protein
MLFMNLLFFPWLRSFEEDKREREENKKEIEENNREREKTKKSHIEFNDWLDKIILYFSIEQLEMKSVIIKDFLENLHKVYLENNRRLNTLFAIDLNYSDVCSKKKWIKNSTQEIVQKIKTIAQEPFLTHLSKAELI